MNNHQCPSLCCQAPFKAQTFEYSLIYIFEGSKKRCYVACVLQNHRATSINEAQFQVRYRKSNSSPITWFLLIKIDMNLLNI